jgi:hypothetical protein
MNVWTSRFVAIIGLSFLLAAGNAAMDRANLTWLNSTSADLVVAHQKEIHGHGYGFQVIGMIVTLSLLVLAVEGLSWCVRGIIRTRTQREEVTQGSV